MPGVIAALVANADGWMIQLLDDDATPSGPATSSSDAASLAQIEGAHQPRWLWNSTATVYPTLLAAGVTVERCIDVTLTERILLARAGRYGEPASVPAILARRDALPAPADADDSSGPDELTLFGPQQAKRLEVTLGQLTAAHADQRLRLPALAGSPAGERIDVDPGALRLLIAAESASALVAVEMGFIGMPWRPDVHDAILVDLLGPRPPAGERPTAMAALAGEIDAAFGHPVNADSPVDLRSAFRRAGFDIATTRSWVLRGLKHPAVAPVLAYKELQRLHTANGWSWLGQWVRDGRFRADYVPGGVVSGRWATRGGGALQIPKVVRRAVVAEAGYRLVVADAAQLEPRVLIAESGDERLAELAAADDLYTALAAVGFSGQRAKAKVAMLGLMYGQTSGEAAALLATLRAHFPVAMEYLERAARRGEQGRLVSSVLGRASHRPGADWQETVLAGAGPDATPAQERRARQVARAWGRFTRNFVIQASAADWAAVWLSCLRRELRAAAPAAELVFFQHDELMVHVPLADAARVADLVVAAAAEAGRLVFPHAAPGWRIPVVPMIVGCYADAAH